MSRKLEFGQLLEPFYTENKDSDNGKKGLRMIKSMTAFSRKDKITADATLTWEMRTVNHRYLDIKLSLPSAFSIYENDLKEIIRNHLGRGKLDAKLTLDKNSADDAYKIQINADAVKALRAARQKIEALTKKPMNLSAMEILQWPGVIQEKENDPSSHLTTIKKLLNTTLIDLINMRELEGERMSQLILSRCDTISEIIKNVQKRRVEVLLAMREKTLKKIAELEITADNNRLEQELVYQAQRLDVDEELDRINSHLKEVKVTLKSKNPVGRRLDFLMQELNREANTLASKSNDAETTKAAVELKVLIEQMREQCLNIE